MGKKSIVEVVPGQTGAFFEPAVEDDLPKLGKVIEKIDASRRAGTVIDHRWAKAIVVKHRGRKSTSGLYDESKRLFQTGGDLDKFVFWKLKLVTLFEDAWKQIVEKTDWIEIIDHQRNECWRMPMARARKYAVRYEAGVGPKIGIPIKHWDIQTHKGGYRQKGES